MSRRELGASPFEGISAVCRETAFHRFSERRQRGFSIRRNIHIHFWIALEILVVAFDKKIGGVKADGFDSGPHDRTRRALELIAERVHGAPEIVHLKTQD